MADEVKLREHIPSSPETFAVVYGVFIDTASSSCNNDGAEITCCSGTPAEIEFSADTIQIDQPKTQVAKDSVTPKKTNSFSIDSILGNWTIDAPTVNTASLSWFASSSVNYQMQTPDWTIRQIYIPNGNYHEPEPDSLYWCHAWDELCENETEAARHQKEHAC
ncbi:hypothetical protein DPMN_155004 [Dreissena polymorpha]|uniref:Uncharacterized protein n=1 Tax=Dreissena polymorpha TaxID=45954 RepID=A0A9D4FR19_DREPO|nr:hypothetical protein DPMN_155004 [Dreissena polymorpha]